MPIRTVADLVQELLKFPQTMPVAVEPANRSQSADIVGVMQDDVGEIPRVYVQFVV